MDMAMPPVLALILTLRHTALLGRRTCVLLWHDGAEELENRKSITTQQAASGV
jgi:hypothetical protein